MSATSRNKMVLKSNCTSPHCPMCAREFFHWYKARMTQMSQTKGRMPSFAEAAATSVRPER